MWGDVEGLTDPKGACAPTSTMQVMNVALIL